MIGIESEVKKQQVEVLIFDFSEEKSKQQQITSKVHCKVYDIIKWFDTKVFIIGCDLEENKIGLFLLNLDDKTLTLIKHCNIPDYINKEKTIISNKAASQIDTLKKKYIVKYADHI